MLLYPSVDKLLNVVDSKYELVHVAARRSKEMARTKYFQLPENRYVSEKYIGRALEEVADNLVRIRNRDVI